MTPPRRKKRPARADTEKVTATPPKAKAESLAAAIGKRKRTRIVPAIKTAIRKAAKRKK